MTPLSFEPLGPKHDKICLKLKDLNDHKLLDVSVGEIVQAAKETGARVYWENESESIARIASDTKKFDEINAILQ